MSPHFSKFILSSGHFKTPINRIVDTNTKIGYTKILNWKYYSITSISF